MIIRSGLPEIAARLHSSCYLNVLIINFAGVLHVLSKELSYPKGFTTAEFCNGGVEVTRTSCEVSVTGFPGYHHISTAKNRIQNVC